MGRFLARSVTVYIMGRFLARSATVYIMGRFLARSATVYIMGRFLARSATVSFTKGFYCGKLDHFRSLLTTVVYKQVFYLSWHQTRQL
jgi:hypothetical protein